MASYHLSVKTIKRSAGRSATAAAAYRAGERIECLREGRTHDYTRKSGVEAAFIVLPEGAPDWAADRAALWNAAEDRETRRNSVTAREWELALPAELDPAARRAVVSDFAGALAARYGVAVDAAIHAPHREGDQRNWHAHVLTSTRRLEPEGFGAKTRELDAKQTGGPEIESMRGYWAELQNRALERAGEVERVDHRSLAMQREAAVSRGDALAAEVLDRPAEIKLGPAASAMERREKRDAGREGRDYAPITERGVAVHQARETRALLDELRRRVERAREVYGAARDEGRDRVGAGLAALRAAVEKERSGGAGDREDGRDDARERLREITGRGVVRGQEPDGGRGEGPEEQAKDGRDLRERLKDVLGRSGKAGSTLDDGREDEAKTRERGTSWGRGCDDDDGFGL